MTANRGVRHAALETLAELPLGLEGVERITRRAARELVCSATPPATPTVQPSPSKQVQGARRRADTDTPLTFKRRNVIVAPSGDAQDFADGLALGGALNQAANMLGLAGMERQLVFVAACLMAREQRIKLVTALHTALSSGSKDQMAELLQLFKRQA